MKRPVQHPSKSTPTPPSSVPCCRSTHNYPFNVFFFFLQPLAHTPSQPPPASPCGLSVPRKPLICPCPATLPPALLLPALPCRVQPLASTVAC